MCQQRFHSLSSSPYPIFQQLWKASRCWYWIINSWVFSSLLSATDTAGHQIYDTSRSTTAVQKQGYTWSIRYGDGSGAAGDVYTDTVEVGGTTVTGQAVEVASRISAQFQRDVDSDGLLGLAFRSGNTGEGNTFRFSRTSLSSSSPDSLSLCEEEGRTLTLSTMQCNRLSNCRFSTMPNPVSRALCSRSTWRKVRRDRTTLASLMIPSTQAPSPTFPSITLEGSGNSPARATRLAVAASGLSPLTPLPIPGLHSSTSPTVSFKITTARSLRPRIALAWVDTFFPVTRRFLTWVLSSTTTPPSFLVLFWTTLQPITLPLVRGK